MAGKQQANPSGASDEQLKAGEAVGKPLGPDVDGSFHVYEFTDPLTGEPYEEKAEAKSEKKDDKK